MNKWSEQHVGKAAALRCLPVLSVLLLFTLAGCVRQQTKPEALKPPPTPPAHDEHLAAIAQQKKQITALQQQLSERDAQIVKLQLRLLEKQAEINQLSVSQEDAIQEVVRAKAKLRSRSNKAESVANMAEVAMMVKTVKRKTLTEQQAGKVKRAEQLMEMSNRALEEGNFDGAAYLAEEALNLVRPIMMQREGEQNGGTDQEQVAFASPLTLHVNSRSNVRDKPDINSRVLFLVDQGDRVKGYAYKGEWIRILDKDGNSGWIYHQLVGTEK